MATKADRYEGIDGLKAYAIIGIALMHVLANGEYGITTRSTATTTIFTFVHCNHSTFLDSLSNC